MMMNFIKSQRLPVKLMVNLCGFIVFFGIGSLVVAVSAPWLAVTFGLQEIYWRVLITAVSAYIGGRWISHLRKLDVRPTAS